MRTLSGDGEVTWSGRDDAGRLVPAGGYWARIATEDGVVAQRIARLR